MNDDREAGRDRSTPPINVVMGSSAVPVDVGGAGSSK